MNLKDENKDQLVLNDKHHVKVDPIFSRLFFSVANLQSIHPVYSENSDKIVTAAYTRGALMCRNKKQKFLINIKNYHFNISIKIYQIMNQNLFKMFLKYKLDYCR